MRLHSAIPLWPDDASRTERRQVVLSVVSFPPMPLPERPLPFVQDLVSRAATALPSHELDPKLCTSCRLIRPISARFDSGGGASHSRPPRPFCTVKALTARALLVRSDHLPREPAQNRVSVGSQVRQLERKEKVRPIHGPRALHPTANLKRKIGRIKTTIHSERCRLQFNEQGVFQPNDGEPSVSAER
jgi:hypothetical protein